MKESKHKHNTNVPDLMVTMFSVFCLKGPQVTDITCACAILRALFGKQYQFHQDRIVCRVQYPFATTTSLYVLFHFAHCFRCCYSVFSPFIFCVHIFAFSAQQNCMWMKIFKKQMSVSHLEITSLFWKSGRNLWLHNNWKINIHSLAEKQRFLVSHLYKGTKHVKHNHKYLSHYTLHSSKRAKWIELIWKMSAHLPHRIKWER